jgi:uncharacterized membrane protein YdjX (TVP38/TMEM64 family)
MVFMRSWLKWVLLLLILAVVGILATTHGQEVVSFLRNPDELRAWLARLGPLGPLGLIVFNAIQVVVAPIPGYPVQSAAGYLFGWWQGSLYAVAGMILGGLLAMTLGRVYGRPLVERVVGAERLERWEKVAHLNSMAVWFVLMLGPLGDAPYFIAGLTKLPIWKLLAIVLLVRTPSVMVSAAIGAGVISWRSPWFIAGATTFIVLGILAGLNEQCIEQWLSHQVHRRRAGPSVESPDETADAIQIEEPPAAPGLSVSTETRVGSSEG